MTIFSTIIFTLIALTIMFAVLNYKLQMFKYQYRAEVAERATAYLRAQRQLKADLAACEVWSDDRYAR